MPMRELTSEKSLLLSTRQSASFTEIYSCAAVACHGRFPDGRRVCASSRSSLRVASLFWSAALFSDPWRGWAYEDVFGYHRCVFIDMKSKTVVVLDDEEVKGVRRTGDEVKTLDVAGEWFWFDAS